MRSVEAQRKAVHRYRVINTIKYSLILNKKTDADVIEWLNTVDNKRGSILKAIREYMKKEEK